MEPCARLDLMRHRGMLSLDQYLDEIEKLSPQHDALDALADGSGVNIFFYAAEISRKFSRKKVVVAWKAFLERRRCARGNSGKGQSHSPPEGQFSGRSS